MNDNERKWLITAVALWAAAMIAMQAGQCDSLRRIEHRLVKEFR